jgi:hypothetical protein
MLGPALVALAGLTSAACAYVSLRRLRRVATATAAHTASLASALRRVPREDRVRTLADRAPSGTWEHHVATELLDAPAEARVGLLNEALAELDHALSQGEGLPAACARLSLLTGGLCAILAFLASLRAAALADVALGAMGAAASAELGRRARLEVVARRGAVDALVQTLAGELEPAGPPSRAPRRWRGPRR